VIIQILIPQSQAVDPLCDQIVQRVFDPQSLKQAAN